MANKKVLVAGFKAGAMAAGVRCPNRLDLGLIAADAPCPAAGIFTTNQVKAPSVILNRKRLSAGMARAVLVNSGNANTCVGPRGMADAMACTVAVAHALNTRPGLVLMNSTGVIGELLPANLIMGAVPALVSGVSANGLSCFARAIMTTDRVPKLAARKVALPGGRVTLAGVGKGAGMIMPNMATMLVYLLTDAQIPANLLKKMLVRAAHDSFNALTVDGDTSTSDSVIIMASGASKIPPAASARGRKIFQDALDDLCLELAVAMAKDGEGATRWYRIMVSGAKSETEADRIARRVANSPLVKTAFHAADPNWGRIMMAVGSAGVKLDPDRVSVRFLDRSKNQVKVVNNGAISPAYAEPAAKKILTQNGFAVQIDLGRGKAHRVIYTCDLSADYVKINAEYRT